MEFDDMPKTNGNPINILVEEFAALSLAQKSAIIYREGLKSEEVISQTVSPMYQEFKQDSFLTLQKYTQKFEGSFPAKPILYRDDLEIKYNLVKKENPQIIAAFEEAKLNIEKFHRLQKPQGFEETINHNKLGFRFQPFDSAALYVPGGKALYPSTVLMGLIPAHIAGVKDLTVLTPTLSETGEPHEVVQAIAYMAGATKILAVGGAQAILAAACGVPNLDISPVDYIYGPGNIYVAAAKSFVFSKGLCGIDSFAGPSEVLIIADETANPKYLAHDLMAQAEHDENAISILLTNNKDIGKKTIEAINQSLVQRANERNEKRLAITINAIEKNCRVLLFEHIDETIKFSNSFAPEHLEIQTTKNEEILNKITAAASIFIGDYSPVAMGDYYSGTNHILPTNGAARFSSGVSVHSFYRRITYQVCSKQGLKKSLDPITIMSQVEGLYDEHGYSVKARFD